MQFIKVSFPIFLYFVQKQKAQGIFLGNLRVRISDLREKGATKSFLKFYSGLKHPKMSVPEGCYGVASALVLKSMCPFTSQKCPSVPRVVLLFSRSALLFPGIALLFSKSTLLFSRSAFFSWNFSFAFSECSFVSWNCSFSPQNCLFVSQKWPIFFQSYLLVFLRCLLFIYFEHLFPRMLFFFFS